MDLKPGDLVTPTTYIPAGFPRTHAKLNRERIVGIVVEWPGNFLRADEFFDHYKGINQYGWLAILLSGEIVFAPSGALETE